MEVENLIQAKRLLWRCFEDVEKQPDSVSADLASDIKNALIFCKSFLFTNNPLKGQ